MEPIEIRASDSIEVGVNESPDLLIYDALLQHAQKCLEENQPECAVVFAQAACEIHTEQIMRELLVRKSAELLADPVFDLLPSFNICNARLRRIYTSLSNDDIGNATFWNSLNMHYKRRNAIVHKGQRCPLNEARESLKAVKEYIDHVNELIGRKVA